MTELSSSPALQGLGGWLALLVIGQVASVLHLLKAIGNDVATLGIPNLLRVARTALYIELTLNLVMLVFVVATTVVMFQKRRIFPNLWKLQAATNLVLSFIGLVVISMMLTIKGEDLAISIAQLVIGLVWLLAGASYLNASARVKNTFVK